MKVPSPLATGPPAKTKTKGAQLCSTLRHHRLYVRGILQARILEWVVFFPFSRGSSQPRSPALQADSLPVEPQGKPKNIGVCSLSLLQQIFPTKEWNRGLLHCRQIPFHCRQTARKVPTSFSICSKYFKFCLFSFSI